MSSTYIICNDNIGLTFNSNGSQYTFYVSATNTKDDTKLLKSCLEKINEMYNPKEPYFFHSKDIVKSIRLEIQSKQANTIFINLWSSFDYRIYKLKFKGIIDEPICFLCSSSDLVSDVISKIKKKFKIVSTGVFKYNGNILDVNAPLNKYNFSSGSFSYNEIQFEQTETAKKVKIPTKDVVVNKENSEEIEKKQIKPKTKKSKEKIPLPLKNALWAKYFSDNMNGICQCCKTTPIHSTNFDCGHIISENDGGVVHLDNLRPICRTCNSSMGTQNMDDYIKKYGFDKL